MVLNDLINNKFFFNSSDSFLNILLINLKNDFIIIKNYYKDFISLKKINKNKILFLFFLPLFYSILFINNIFFYFIALKVFFYTLKFLFKYIYLFFEYFYIKYLPKNRYIRFIFSLFYKIIFKLTYNIYLFIFYLLPQIIYIDFWLGLINLLKKNLYLKIHFFLDFIEGIPSSKFIRYIYFLVRSINEKWSNAYRNYFRKEARNYYYNNIKFIMISLLNFLMSYIIKINYY